VGAVRSLRRGESRSNSWGGIHHPSRAAAGVGAVRCLRREESRRRSSSRVRSSQELEERRE
jgi:hypothetical protein